MVPRKAPVGLVICSARTYTRDYQDMLDAWTEAGVAVWGSVPERVTIAAGPEAYLPDAGLDAYRGVWRRALRAVAWLVAGSLDVSQRAGSSHLVQR